MSGSNSTSGLLTLGVTALLRVCALALSRLPGRQPHVPLVASIPVKFSCGPVGPNAECIPYWSPMGPMVGCIPYWGPIGPMVAGITKELYWVPMGPIVDLPPKRLPACPHNKDNLLFNSAKDWLINWSEELGWTDLLQAPAEASTFFKASLSDLILDTNSFHSLLENTSISLHLLHSKWP